MARVVDWAESRRRLRFTRSGRLEPFLGNALRGVLGIRLKQAECRITPSPLYCRDANPGSVDQRCPFHGDCAYGDILEPAPAPGRIPERGKEDLLRPLVIAAEFPAPDQSFKGLEISISALFLGERAAACIPKFWDALAEAGADPDAGIGPDRATFAVIHPASQEPPERFGTLNLPLSAEESPGVIEQVRVVLMTPLHLREARRPVHSPTFAQLIRGGLRTIGAAGRLYGEMLAEDVFARVKEEALLVPTCLDRTFPFTQRRFSNRTRQSVDYPGRLGDLSYGPLPRWLLPWLMAAGIMRIGLHRVSGAGGFIVENSH